MRVGRFAQHYSLCFILGLLSSHTSHADCVCQFADDVMYSHLDSQILKDSDYHADCEAILLWIREL
jgi:hypothetical protein